ncbi:MAG: acetyl-CoA carboxylase, carboxyltransferase subunit beta [Planctomycetota bacterium]|jgi:acetyl-CoA carboxylase carboxyl transferase subunit beta
MAWARFKKKDMPGGLWIKCPACGEVIYKKDLEEKLKVCPKCDHHNTLNGMERVRYTLDEGSAVELVEDMQAVDRLEFEDKTKYSDKLAATMEKTKRKEAIWIGTGTILGRDVAFGTLDFSFLGGSMGVVVGEKVAIIAEYALKNNLPLVMVAASGGARMHEGALSLMQMAKTCAVLGRFDNAGKLYISVLANPTTGGVTASWATQADVVLAEPGALIGFAGPRVIKTTLRQDLPEGFQRSEFLINKGQIDNIVHRERLRETIYDIMDFCLPLKNGRRKKAAPVAAAPAEAGKAEEAASGRPPIPEDEAEKNGKEAAESSKNKSKEKRAKSGRKAKRAAERK